jgi:hypothetical protein
VKESCTLIEFVGIPYSWKTSTMNELQRLFRSHDIITYPVQEFRGAEDFYSQRKFSPDINLIRAINFMREFIQVSRDDRTSIILVDRGLFDARCWMKWFDTIDDVPHEYIDIVNSLINSVRLFADKYRIIWMDRSPIDALRNHGRDPGRIVNFSNLSSLRSIYDQEISNIEFHASCLRIDSDLGSAQHVAQQIAMQLKII